MRRAWVILVTAIAVAAAAGCVTAVSAQMLKHRHVVLGAKRFAAPYGQGWGTVKPGRIYNGGDPSGLVVHIHWHHWGHKTARGRGLTSLFKPHGGYYRKRGPIQLKAHALGHCASHRAFAYRKLSVRVAKTPNSSPRGHWFSWSGSSTICSPGF